MEIDADEDDDVDVVLLVDVDEFCLLLAFIAAEDVCCGFFVAATVLELVLPLLLLCSV